MENGNQPDGGGALANMKSAQVFCTQILERAEQTIATTILTALSTREVGSALAQFMTSGQDNPLLEISIRLKPEIIGIGAGSPFFLPGAAKLLGTTVRFPTITTWAMP